MAIKFGAKDHDKPDPKLSGAGSRAKPTTGTLDIKNGATVGSTPEPHDGDEAQDLFSADSKEVKPKRKRK